MEKDPKIYLNHILDSISRVKEYTKGFKKDDFLNNKMVQDAVIRNFEIIGEATKQINQDFRNKYPSIEWKKISGMRDKLIHDYMGVDLWAVWAVVNNILPDLEQQINEILRKENF